MIVWRWVRGLRWWWQTLIALIGLPLALVVLYVALRSAQFLVAEGDAGLYAPETPALIRMRNLEGHLERLESSFAWTTIERKLLRDPALRPRLNAALKDAGLPTLDLLQDPRKNGQFSRANLYFFGGRDVVVGLSGPKAFCASTRLSWLQYLGIPFAPLVLEKDGDTLRVPGRKLWVAFEGAIAIAGSDKALVEAALRGRGRPPEGTRPVEAVVRFEGAFADLRATLAKQNLLPHLRVETAKALRISADLDGSAARVEAVMEGVEAAYPGPPPGEILARAPAPTTGMFSSTASFRELYDWLGGQGKTARELADQLERGKLSEVLLPLIEPGVAVLTGTAENQGKLYPAFVLMVRASDPKRAIDALGQVVKKIGGPFADRRINQELLGDGEVFSMDPPDGAKVDDFLTPTWGSIEGGLVFGNNLVFTKSVIASGGELWRERRIARRLAQRMKELGFSERPGLAGGVLVPPLLRESLDGAIQYFSRAMAVPSDVALRQALERDWTEQGRSGMPEDEKGRLFQEAREAKIQDYEAELRRGLRGLEPVRWCAFESAEVPGGVSLRLAIGFDNLSDR